MKNRTPTMVIGGLLLVIFLFLLFAFQVRTTEIAVVTTFGSISGAPRTEPGLYLDRKSTRLNSSHLNESRMPSSA